MCTYIVKIKQTGEKNEMSWLVLENVNGCHHVIFLSRKSAKITSCLFRKRYLTLHWTHRYKYLYKHGRWVIKFSLFFYFFTIFTVLKVTQTISKATFQTDCCLHLALPVIHRQQFCWFKLILKRVKAEIWIYGYITGPLILLKLLPLLLSSFLLSILTQTLLRCHLTCFPWNNLKHTIPGIRSRYLPPSLIVENVSISALVSAASPANWWVN